MAFAKFQENRFRIDGEIAENHAILVNLTASIVISYRFIGIPWVMGYGPMLWVYGDCIFFNSFSAGLDLRRQNLICRILVYIDGPRAERVRMRENV